MLQQRGLSLTASIRLEAALSLFCFLSRCLKLFAQQCVRLASLKKEKFAEVKPDRCLTAPSLEASLTLLWGFLPLKRETCEKERGRGRTEMEER